MDQVEPVIADIGMEVDDDEDGVFRLHLAMGYGHELPVTIGGAEYKVWTPSAMVLHRPAVTTTSKWQQGLVNEFDKP